MSWNLTAVLVCIPLMTMTDPDYWFLLTFRTSLPLPKAEAYRWVSFSETFCFWVVCRGKERHGELRWGMWTEGLPMVCDLWAHSASAPPGNWAHNVGHRAQPIPMPNFLCSPELCHILSQGGSDLCPALGFLSTSVGVWWPPCTVSCPRTLPCPGQWRSWPWNFLHPLFTPFLAC